MSDYPENDKMAAVSADCQVIGEFLEWLQGEGGVLLVRDDPQGVHAHRPLNINKLLAKYFQIDLEKLETEQRAMLAKIREDNP